VFCVCLMSLLVIVTRLRGPSKRVINYLSKLKKKRGLTRKWPIPCKTCKVDLKAEN
jgi:hypothetical protein